MNKKPQETVYTLLAEFAPEYCLDCEATNNLHLGKLANDIKANTLKASMFDELVDMLSRLVWSPQTMEGLDGFLVKEGCTVLDKAKKIKDACNS